MITFTFEALKNTDKIISGESNKVDILWKGYNRAYSKMSMFAVILYLAARFILCVGLVFGNSNKVIQIFIALCVYILKILFTVTQIDREKKSNYYTIDKFQVIFAIISDVLFLASYGAFYCLSISKVDISEAMVSKVARGVIVSLLGMILFNIICILLLIKAAISNTKV